MLKGHNSSIHWISPLGIFMCLLLSIPNANAQTPTLINMCYEEQELEPYFMGTGHQTPEQYPGIFVEIVQLLDNNVPDVSIIMHRAPWKRCLNELKQNISDVVISSYTPDRESFAVYPTAEGKLDENQAISMSQYCLFTKRSSELVWNGQQFSTIPDKPVSVPQGYSIISMLENHKLPLVFTNSSVAAMDLLAKAVTSGTVTYCEAGANYLWKNADRNTGVIAQSPTLSQKYAYLVFSKSFEQTYPSLTRQLWREVASIRDSTFPRLLDKYESLKFDE